ncbi:MAG: patatin-like phospholipase family protein, partial [Ignavibacteriaceae bacterium]
MNTHEKELRIGLVLYGGVSLCIYIYGVAVEFLRFVRGEGVYKKLNETAKIKPKIDVISGTSAGGINGIFLAKALSSGASLDPLKSLWIEEGDLEKLIDTGDKPISLIDSQYYLGKLNEALTKVGETASPKSTNSDLLDLFITATDLDGVYRSFKDEYFRYKVTVKNYDTVFHFKVRPSGYDLSSQKENAELNKGRTGRDDFSNEGEKNKFLAKIAGTTSAFPFAFAPVKYSLADKKKMTELFQQNIIEGNTTEDTIYGDGGMVNNRPFNYTVKTIFNRHHHI